MRLNDLLLWLSVVCGVVMAGLWLSIILQANNILLSAVSMLGALV